MKNKQAAVYIKQQIDPSAILKYPKVHTKDHPDDFKIPIADLLNPECPISAGVNEELRAELLKLKAKRIKYYYVADPVVTLDTSNPASKALVDDVLRGNLLKLQADDKTQKKDTETICFVDTVLDRKNPISNILIDDDVRRLVMIIKAISEGTRAYLSPEESDDVLSFFFSNTEAVINNLYKLAVEKGIDEHSLPIAEIFNSELFITALKQAGYKSEPAADLPQVPIAHPDKVYLPVDVVNNQIWSGLEKLSKPTKRGQIKGQLAFFDVADHLKHFEFNYINAAKNTSNPAFIILGTDFEKVENTALAKTLTEYDKLVYQAIGSLWRYCTDTLNIPPDKVVITTGLIYWAMGYNEPPGVEATKKLIATLSKLRRAEFYLNNIYEVKEHKNRTQFNYKGVFLPSEEIQAIVNGVVVDSAIHLFREPPLITFARERGQITTIDRNLLAEMPLDKSERSIGLFHYLITQISLVKNPKNKMANTKLLYATIFEQLDIDGPTEKDKKARTRTKKNTQKLLYFFTEKGIIDGFVEKNLQGGQGIELLINIPKLTAKKDHNADK
ncbi:MAG: hypothetical protein J5659_04765 [Clostridia bacterium]|nr:hypothetical protein [Clostridia bacterium]